MKYTKSQWDAIDNLPSKDLFKYAEKLSRTRLVPGGDWYQLCCINTQFINTKSWSVKQKRWIATLILRHWDELSALDETFCI